MPELFLNPKLPNYFVSASDVESAITARSFVSEYEDGKVVTFPSLKAELDHDFWAGLDADDHPALKKFAAYLKWPDYADVEHQRRRLVKQGVEPGLAATLSRQLESVYRAVMPLYDAVFSGYYFEDENRKVVWRLNTVMNENMHIDTYKEENHQHFARMFINLDNQPRIWHTSWPIDDMVSRLASRFPRTGIELKGRAQIWSEINSSTFGKSTSEWWDSEPRHVAYFAPGDIWIADSRQIAHQIFYGRRALSIDFAVQKEQMKNPRRHYLEIAERFRADVMQRSAGDRPAQRPARRILETVSSFLGR
jgi:hypothetical protein